MKRPPLEKHTSDQGLTLVQKRFYQLGEALIRLNARRVAAPFFTFIRFLRRNNQPNLEPVPAAHPQEPTGPFTQTGPQNCAILNFVPRDIKSRLIDHVSGGYGYSHTTVDIGEIDEPTGKRVMIEAMPFQKVRRAFQDEYGQRPFIRIPIAPYGVDCQTFSECVKSKLGEKYGYAEALTWGEVDDPARQVCTDLASGCLPTPMRLDIAQQHRLGQLKRSSVSAHHWKGDQLELFVSPNGLAQYFHLPHGEEIDRPDTLASVAEVNRRAGLALPIPSELATGKAAQTAGVLVGITGAAIIAALLWSKKSPRSKS